MVAARDARAWAADGGLHGIGDSLYTPLDGRDGDDIDWDAYRTLVRYCVGDLRHDMLWLTSGIARVVVADDPRAQAAARGRGRRSARDQPRDRDPGVHRGGVGEGHRRAHARTRRSTAPTSRYIQTPPMEVHGGEGVLRFFQYLADRTDLALGMFNSPSSGYVLTPAEMAAIYDAVPAVVAVKEGVQDSIMPTLELHALVPSTCRSGSATSWSTRPGGSRTASSRRRSSGRPGTSSRRPTTCGTRSTGELIWDGATRRGAGVLEGELDPLRPRPGRPLDHARTRAGPSTSRTGARRTSSRPR